MKDDDNEAEALVRKLFLMTMAGTVIFVALALVVPNVRF